MKCHQTQPLISERRYLHTYMESTRNDHTSQTPPIPHRHHQTSALCPLPRPHLTSPHLASPHPSPPPMRPRQLVTLPSPAQPNPAPASRQSRPRENFIPRFDSFLISSHLVSFHFQAVHGGQWWGRHGGGYMELSTQVTTRYEWIRGHTFVHAQGLILRGYICYMLYVYVCL